MSQNSEEKAFSEDLFNTEELLGNDEFGNTEETPMESTEIREENTDKIDETEEISKGDEGNNNDTENIDIDDATEPNGREQSIEDNEEEEEESQDKEKPQVVKKPVTNAQNRLTELPLAKIKHIIKLDPDVKLVNGEAVFIITKSTELFIKALAKESFGFAAQNRKKTIVKSHVDSALASLPVEL